jgi:hypothetical protein
MDGRDKPGHDGRWRGPPKYGDFTVKYGEIPETTVKKIEL